MVTSLKGNKERFSGFANIYDSARPKPPEIIYDIVKIYYSKINSLHIADLGCGTGQSTVFWADKAIKIFGIEPNIDMLNTAITNSSTNNIQFIKAISSETGLSNNSIDIVTCSQSLHWMEPTSTFQEIYRILKPNGLFIAYDCDWPPSFNCEAEKECLALMSKIKKLETKHKTFEKVSHWPKDSHIRRMKESSKFKFTKELSIHSKEAGNAERFLNLALSQGQLQTLLKLGIAQQETGFDEFKGNIKTIMKEKNFEWIFSYKVRIGIK